ncbi:hypothetical protein [Acinetobacter courvalinii]|uniref:hypothetical protein n=1 Tax=Acinetobacter courvalinii TaxID=280147 RepID=UPI003F56E4BD
MSLKLLGIIISLLSCLGLYLSHPNQIFLETQLGRYSFYIALIGLLLGLSMLLYALPLLVAILIWLAIATLVWSFAPLLMLMRRSK